MRRPLFMAIVLAGFAAGAATTMTATGAPVLLSPDDPTLPPPHASQVFPAKAFFDVFFDVRPDNFDATGTLTESEPSPVFPIATSLLWLEPQSAINYESEVGAGDFTRFAMQPLGLELVGFGTMKLVLPPDPDPNPKPDSHAANAFHFSVEDPPGESGEFDDSPELWDLNSTLPDLDVLKTVDVIPIELPDARTVALIAIGVLGLRWLWHKLSAGRQGA
jgi:hypothetical protein